MNDRKKKIEISYWKVGDADGFQAVNPVETDEEMAIADCYNDEKDEYDREKANDRENSTKIKKSAAMR